MKKLKFVIPFLFATGFLLTACSTNIPATDNYKSSSSANVSSAITSQSTISSSYTPSSAQNSQATTSNASNPPKSAAESTPKNENIVQKTKEYILNGQIDKAEADKLKWSESFLNQVNIEAVYQKYTSTSDKPDDIESFAKYLTQNAPIPSNWKKLFEADLLKTYGEKISRYAPLQDNLYQVYVKKDGADVPYVVVNIRTGYFHG